MKKGLYFFALTLVALASLLLGVPAFSQGNSECLTCHGDASMQDGSGHSLAVDELNFHDSTHGSLKCKDCHSAISG